MSGSLNLDTSFEGSGDPQPVSLDFLSPALGPDELGWLAHYRVLKVLGQGGMGVVLLAEDTQLQRHVALKVIRPEVGQNLANRQRFLREARAMAQVRSDHVVTVHQVGQADDVCYLAMELLDGEPLDRWLASVGTVPLGEALRVGREIALALAAAHARGLVHRDVKPANVWLEAPVRRVKLLDFGLARPQTADANLTNPGMVVGTPMYMAPEQALGEPLDGRADLFSLGCVLYQMVTGRPPFEGKTALAVMSAVVTQTPPVASQLNPAVSILLNDLLARLLAKQPADRPVSAEAVSGELQALERAETRRADRSAPGATAATPIGQVLSPSHLLWSGVQPTSPSAETPDPSASVPVQPRVPESEVTPRSGRRAREAERRQVTVLVCGCDLFESDVYLELETEDQAQLLGNFQQACGQAIRHFDGTVVQCNEQGLLACFGYPVAHEDAALRAARAGLRLLADVNALAGQLHKAHNFEPSPWVGLHTGPAIVEVKEDALSLVGDARNVAVRLEEAAAPGQVICTEATHRLFRGRFQCASLGPRKIKGVAHPVELFRVEGSGEARSPIEAAEPAELSPLTGRDNEISLLKDRWEQAQEGMGQVVLLIGEPGLGKSRLVHTLKQHVLGQMVEGEVDAPVIEWRCSPHFQNTGLYPAIDFYERALAFDREEPAEDRFDRMLHRLEQYDLVRPETVPLWASLLSLPTPDRFPPLSLSPIRQRQETFRTLLEWLHTRATRKPILFIVEDLHWVDASTLEFLGQFLAEGLHDSILTLLTFRPEFKTPWPAVAHQTSLALNRLTRRQVGELMRKKTESDLPEAVVGQIYERTGGVPLFVEEFTKMVQESEASASRASGQTLLGREIPATLQDLMMVRLDRMEGERELAQLAATLGREFSHELLAAVAALDEPTLQGELAKLIQAEILYAKGRPPRCSYIFKHALLEDALYNALVKGKRQQFHRRIAEVLEAQFSQTAETRPELLAHHFTEAGIGDRAVGYWLKAGLRSRDRSAEIEAIGHLTKGLELISTFPESPERDAQELPFLHPLGTANIVSRGYTVPEVGPIFNRARELCAKIGEPQTFAIRWGTWAFHVTRGDLRLCMELSKEAMLLAEELNDPGTLMEALFMPGLTLFMRADFAGARACHVRALANYDDRARTKYWASRTGQDSGVTHRCFLAMGLWHLGYPDQALQMNREMRDVARTIGHPFSLAYGLAMTGWLYQHCRLGAEAEAAGDEELGLEPSFDYWHTSGLLFKAGGILLQGRVEDALALLPLMREQVYRGIWACALTCYFTIAGEAYTRAFRFDDARRILDEGLAVSEERDERSLEAELYRLKGELHLAETDDSTAAEACFHTAIETARRQQSKAWELRATMSLARLWQRQGRRDEARAALAAIYDTYTEGFTTPDLVDAKALLESLAESDPL